MLAGDIRIDLPAYSPRDPLTPSSDQREGMLIIFVACFVSTFGLIVEPHSVGTSFSSF